MIVSHVQVIGEDKAALHIQEMATRAANLRPALNEMKKLINDGFRKQFESQGAYFGSPWPALDPDTVERKGSSSPLVASGKLRAALSGGAGRKTRVTSSSVTVGTSLWYAHFAEGTGRQPERKLSGVAPTQLIEAKNILERYVVHGLV